MCSSLHEALYSVLPRGRVQWDDEGVGICDWEAPDAEAVERIVKELGAPYDEVVAVKQALLDQSGVG